MVRCRRRWPILPSDRQQSSTRKTGKKVSLRVKENQQHLKIWKKNELMRLHRQTDRQEVDNYTSTVSSFPTHKLDGRIDVRAEERLSEIKKKHTGTDNNNNKKVK
jgi:hypothetical protein